MTPLELVRRQAGTGTRSLIDYTERNHAIRVAYKAGIDIADIAAAAHLTRGSALRIATATNKPEHWMTEEESFPTPKRKRVTVKEVRQGIQAIADSLEPHTEYETIQKLLDLLARTGTGAPSMPPIPAVTEATIRAAFRAGMEAGFSISSEEWNGENLYLGGDRSKEAAEQELSDQIDLLVPAFLAVYLKQRCVVNGCESVATGVLDLDEVPMAVCGRHLEEMS